MLSFELQPNLVQLLRDLNNKFSDIYAELTQYDEKTREKIHRYAKISMIGASTRIENAVLTDTEIDWIDTILSTNSTTTAFNAEKSLIENKLSKDRERSIEEVAGCRAMLELIYSEAQEINPLTEISIRGLHHELMHYYNKAKHHAGQYKTSPNSVIETQHSTNEQRVVFQTAEAGPITEAAMSDLVKWYNEYYHTVSWTLPFACEFTYRFLAIHPFQDGNGRLGRGLFLLTLLQSPENTISKVAPYLPIDRHIEKRKSEYYSVLNRCSSGIYQRDAKQYHIDIFLKFMLKVLDASLDDIRRYKEKCDRFNKLSETSMTILACFKEHPEVRLTAKEIEAYTKIAKRTINHSLSTLMNGEFIQKYGQGAGTRYQLVF